MKKKYIILFSFNVLLISSLFLLSSWKPLKEKKETKRPNFLFVLVDDQPFDALESSGRYSFLKTPNMQHLGDKGAKFENYDDTQSICSTSRASFLTGTYPIFMA